MASSFAFSRDKDVKSEMIVEGMVHRGGVGETARLGYEIEEKNRTAGTSRLPGLVMTPGFPRERSPWVSLVSWE